MGKAARAFRREKERESNKEAKKSKRREAIKKALRKLRERMLAGDAKQDKAPESREEEEMS